MTDHKENKIDTNKPKFVEKYGVWIITFGMVAFLIVIKILFNYLGM